MNLVAKEYVAARIEQTGVLILSEMAGAAKELGEAILISPNSIEEIADALQQALEMPIAEQARRMRVMQTRLKRYNVVRWADDFIQALRAVKEEQEKIAVRYLDPPTIRGMVERFHRAQQRLFLLDYDGTLAPLIIEPQEAQPSAELLAILERLAQDPKNEIVLISGRDRKTMQRWFNALNIGLVAEHGAWIREKNAAWRLTKPLKNDWKPPLLTILERRADRLPGAFVEEKEFSIVWHYRNADPELGALRAQELLDDLVNFVATREIQILQGDKIVEVRNSGVNKGTIASHWLSQAVIDFILAAGDDETDEDLFRILPSIAYSIRIGIASTHAGYNLLEPAEMIELLRRLAQI
jgi:trehalose 6-phosphate synthase/phosphatase